MSCLSCICSHQGHLSCYLVHALTRVSYLVVVSAHTGVGYLVLSCNAHNRVSYLVHAHTRVSYFILYMLTPGSVILCYLLHPHMFTPGSVILCYLLHPHMFTPASVILCYLLHPHMFTPGSVILCYLVHPRTRVSYLVYFCICSHEGRLPCVNSYRLTPGSVILYMLTPGSLRAVERPLKSDF